MTDAVVERPAAPPPRPAGRKRRILKQFITFGMVGSSGFVVNQGVMVLSNKVSQAVWDFDQYHPFVNIFGSAFHVRWYHVFSVLAFVVANIWNFVLNRRYTFKAKKGTPWLRPMFSFMLVGIFGLLITLLVQTVLVNDDSPIALSRSIWDDSTGLRTRAYWGNFIGVVVAIPANFLFNKLWTFRHPPGAGEVKVKSVG